MSATDSTAASTTAGAHAPASYDRRGAERRGRPRTADDGAPSSADVTGFLRVLRWGSANWKTLAIVSAAAGAGRFVRPEYVGALTGVTPPPAVAAPVRAELDALRTVDSQLRLVDDTSRADRAELRREITTRTSAIARGICALQSPAQRELGALPCTTLLDGGTWESPTRMVTR